jgi:hypothetical protein
VKRKSCTDRVSVLNWITLSLLFYCIFLKCVPSFSRQLSVAFMACLWQLAFSLPGRLYLISSILVALQSIKGVGQRVVYVSRSHTFAHTHTTTPAWTLLNEWPASRRGRYLVTQQTHQTNVSARDRTNNPSIRAAAYLRITPHVHRVPQLVMLSSSYVSWWNRSTPRGLIFTTNFRYIPIWLRSDSCSSHDMLQITVSWQTSVAVVESYCKCIYHNRDRNFWKICVVAGFFFL